MAHRETQWDGAANFPAKAAKGGARAKKGGFTWEMNRMGALKKIEEQSIRKKGGAEGHVL